ncbi:zinc finger protein 518A-like [Myxocyprinus asiaticus]|uniref:zinc finger protein 518A-like n=1 Tax=Myxocyprinus asiaticus TaxID=70543 RepID=UPI002221DA21|nr:zinc finger protein 518A-like [Myxocyprinus asiaticus]
MNVDNDDPDTHANSNGQIGNEEKGNWHKRLRLRKTTSSSPAQQITVKEKKNITEENHGRETTEMPKKTPQNLQHDQTADTPKTQLMFICSACNDGRLFRSSELLVHFKTVHEGKGSPPSFPCNMCHFSTPVFTTLQKHRMKHKDCLLTCEICNDNVLQTLPQLTKHCQTHHTLNDQYHCHTCSFSVKEIKQFVCHSCPAPIKNIHEESITDGKFKNSLLADAAGTTQKDELLKHMACRQRWSRRNWWRKREPASKPDNNLSQDFRFPLPKPEPQWASPVFSAPGLLDDHGVLLDPEKTLEETQQFLQRTVNGGQKWPISLKSEQDQTTPSPAQSKAMQCSTPHLGLHHARKDKLTGLMEKNNISVPPDCTTKVVGFKMVDGKKHLVLKVIPTTKREVSSPRESKDIESRSQAEKPSDQTWVVQDKSNNVSTSNASGNLTSRGFVYQAEKQGPGINQQDFLSPIAIRRKSQQGDGFNNQEHSDCKTPLNDSENEENLNAASHRSTKESPSCKDITSDFNSDSERIKETKNTPKEVRLFTEAYNQSSSAKRVTKDHQAACESEENCTSDLALSLAADTGSLEELCSSRLVPLQSDNESTTRFCSTIIDQGVEKVTSEIKQPPNTDSFLESCSVSEFDCTTPATGSPLKDLTESSCRFQGGDGDVLFNSSGDECTNNMDHRDSLLPVGQYDCEMRESRCASDMYQTVDELPITTISHLLDGVKAQRTLLLDNSTGGLTSDEFLKGSTCTGAANQQSEPVNTDITSSSVPSSTESSEPSIKQSSIPLASQNELVMNRKRMGEQFLDDSLPASKFQKRSTLSSEDVTVSLLHWEPEPRDVLRTLRLIPHCSSQSVKIPHDNQPVIVLNHPDSDIPEVMNIMRVVHKHGGAVERVVLSRKTINALSELNCDNFRNNIVADCHASHCRREWPNGTVKEKFSLKLKLKRVCGRKYTVVPTVSESIVLQPTFRCWFCGRLFRNQEAWVGHGQRHLMEATRGWNKLFNR